MGISSTKFRHCSKEENKILNDRCEKKSYKCFYIYKLFGNVSTVGQENFF